MEITLSLIFLAAALLGTARSSTLYNYYGSQPGESITCQEISLTGDTPVYIQSAGVYPYSYPNNHDACWLVRSQEPDVKPILRVTYSAIEALFGFLCTAADFIEVRDGNSMNATLLLRWCGWGHPNFPFEANGDVLLIYFHTDSSVSYGGFEMKAYLNATAEDIRSPGNTHPTFPPLGQLPGRGLLPGGGRPRRPEGSGAGQGRGQGRGPGLQTTTQSSQSFNNDDQSRRDFNNNLRKNLASRSGQSGKDTGMIVGIVIAVLLGVTLLGVSIHVLTKACVNKNRPAWNPLENVIVPPRRRQLGFDSLNVDATGEVGAGLSGAGGASSGKYALPGPVVSTPQPRLVFANPSALHTMPPPAQRASATNHGYAEDTPAAPAQAQCMPQPVSRNLLTTTANNMVNTDKAVGDVDTDTDTSTPRDTAPPQPVFSVGDSAMLPPLRGVPTSFPAGPGGLPAPPPLYSRVDGDLPRSDINASHVSLPPAYDDLSTC